VVFEPEPPQEDREFFFKNLYNLVKNHMSSRNCQFNSEVLANMFTNPGAVGEVAGGLTRDKPLWLDGFKWSDFIPFPRAMFL